MTWNEHTNVLVFTKEDRKKKFRTIGGWGMYDFVNYEGKCMSGFWKQADIVMYVGKNKVTILKNRFGPSGSYKIPSPHKEEDY